MATEKMVKVILPNKRMYRANAEDRKAIEVGPGETEVPQWVAEAWNLTPKTPQAPALTLDAVLATPGLSKTAIAAIQKHFNPAAESTDETATTETE
jgi:hypothetical protein